MARKLVDIRPLKAFVFKLPLGNPLREVILADADSLDALTFVSRLSLWLRLARTMERPYAPAVGMQTGEVTDKSSVKGGSP